MFSGDTWTRNITTTKTRTETKTSLQPCGQYRFLSFRITGSLAILLMAALVPTWIGNCFSIIRSIMVLLVLKCSKLVVKSQLKLIYDAAGKIINGILTTLSSFGKNNRIWVIFRTFFKSVSRSQSDSDSHALQ